MQKLLAITWKGLYTTFRDRNLILIMFVTPLVLSTIMGLAFGGLSGGSGLSIFQDIPIAVVNLDAGFTLADRLPAMPDGTDSIPSLDDLEFEVGGETINVGEQLRLNTNLAITDARFASIGAYSTSDRVAGNVSFAYGDLLASILLSETITAFDDTTNTTTTGTLTSTGTTSAGGFNLDDLTCPLFGDEGDGGESDEDERDAQAGFTGTLGELFEGVRLADADAARAGVDRGDYVAAVIIPADFTATTLPTFDIFDNTTRDDTSLDNATGITPTGAVEIYANGAQPISAGIVRAVVEGIVNQLARASVALDALLNATLVTLQETLTLDSLDDLDLSTLDPQMVTGALQSIDPALFEPVACLLLPNAGSIRLVRQPLDEVQTRSPFAAIMILLGSAQAIFFAMFTGIFGINSIYEERDNWTLQRIIASPTPRAWILGGKLLGNVAVVLAQLVILFLAFTLIASLMEGQPVFIWGSNIPALLAVLIAIALFTSGLGVLVVGIAKNAQQVQFFGPMVASVMGALGGSFGFRLPRVVARFSPIWWGTEALQQIANGERDSLGLALLVLFGSAAVVFAVGVLLFRRRLDL